MQAYIVRYAAKNAAVFNHKQRNYAFIQGTRSSNLLVGLHRVGFEIPRLFFFLIRSFLPVAELMMWTNIVKQDCTLPLQITVLPLSVFC